MARMPAHTMSATISPKRTRFLFSTPRYIASAITVMALSIIQIKFSMMLVIICETCTVFRDLLSSFFALPQMIYLVFLEEVMY